ncbi:MAG: RluA family pseudouridine synthase [Planctomycetaceae bacterium]|nr:RluA family pseudouridine synthase [Planctomycetaceae bacterium]
MNPLPFDVLYEDNHLLAVSKPAGLPTMGTPGGQPTLLTLCKDYIKQRYNKPGNVYLGVMSRLDAPVTGVVLIARTSKAAARLTEQFRTHTVEKTYWAIIEGVIEPAAAALTDWLGQDERHRRMHIVGPTIPDAREARLSYRRIQLLPGDRSWLEVILETGRKHQIRLQLSHAGHPIVGDRKYGSRIPFPAGIALHARRLVVAHPTTGAAIALEAPPPASWRRFGIREA